MSFVAVRTILRGGVVAGALVGLAGLLSVPSAGCLTSNVDPFAEAGAEGGSAVVEGDDPTKNEANADKLTTYRDLATHPGCTTDGLSTRKANAYEAAVIPGYRCAAKAYPVIDEDTKKPIVLLVHGNSSTPADWEKYPEGSPDALPMLSERLSSAGFRVYASDVRFDKNDDPKGNNATENAGMNFDHGWAVPIVQHFIDSMMTAFPGREFSIVAFSVGPTVVRDALRRLHREGKKPFERMHDLVFAAGANHGVSSFRALCGTNPTMRGRVACELGDRTAFQPTDLSTPLNGPGNAWETPCSDGETAFGQRGVCGGHKVTYTTLVMKDISEGTYQDEFVSEGSTHLEGAENLTVSLSDSDESGYFYSPAFKNHYGAIRSEAALKILTDTLAD